MELLKNKVNDVMLDQLKMVVDSEDICFVEYGQGYRKGKIFEGSYVTPSYWLIIDLIKSITEQQLSKVKKCEVIDLRKGDSIKPHFDDDVFATKTNVIVNSGNGAHFIIDGQHVNCEEGDVVVFDPHSERHEITEAFSRFTMISITTDDE